MLPVHVYVTIGWKPNQAPTRSAVKSAVALTKTINAPALPPVGCSLLFGEGRYELVVEAIVLDPDEQMFGLYCRDRWHAGPGTERRASAEVEGLVAIGFRRIGKG